MNRIIIGIALASLLSQAATAASCDFSGTPPGLGNYHLEDWITGLNKPVKAVVAPGTQTLYVVEQAGTVRAITNNQLESGLILDIRDRVTELSGSGDERGFLGLAFHPHFAENKRLFVNYTTRSQLRTRISEFKMGSDGKIPSSTEKVILEIPQPYSNHNGGDLNFGNDGYLYIGMGDGGSGGDPQNYAQNLKSLLGKMLRIDIDSGSPYAIPSDNPFINVSGAKPEIFAYGLRNPWRFSVDRVTGEIWAGDVGQNRWEEIDIIKKGGNYGWKIREASDCFEASSCQSEGLIPPVFEYARSDGFSVTGGFVYRGTRFPNLIGTYIFGDFGSGKIWGHRPEETKILATPGLPIAAFAEDKDGEPLVVIHNGPIRRLVPNSMEEISAFPLKASDTGCFSSLNPPTPISRFVAYDVNSPLWSDGTEKDRFVLVPEGKKVNFRASAPWEFPTGTVVMKNFYAPTMNGKKVIETRFLVKRAQHFEGYSYRWDDTANDAVLLGGATVRSVTLWESGSEKTISYYYPSQSDCRRCHDVSAGEALGLNTPQANKGEQLKNLVTRNILQDVPSDISTLPKLVSYLDTTQSVTNRARAYLHSQCAHCHNPDNTVVQGRIDLRYHPTLASMNLLAVAPTQGDLGVSGAKLVTAGEPDRSILFLRTRTLDSRFRMPTLASRRVDVKGLEVLEKWIREME